jgi:hypothetical protein
MKRGTKLALLSAALAAGFCVFAAALFVADMGVCRYIAGSQDISFARVSIGDSRESVIARVGAPSFIERADPARHFMPACRNGCAEKFVYNFYICLDLKSRYIGFDEKGMVVSKDTFEPPLRNTYKP